MPKIEQILMNRKEVAYQIIDCIDGDMDYNFVLEKCIRSFPDIDFCNLQDGRTLRQALLDEVINK